MGPVYGWVFFISHFYLYSLCRYQFYSWVILFSLVCLGPLYPFLLNFSWSFVVVLSVSSSYFHRSVHLHCDSVVFLLSSLFLGCCSSRILCFSKLILRARFGGSNEHEFHNLHLTITYISLNTCVYWTVGDLIKALVLSAPRVPGSTTVETGNTIREITVEVIEPNDEDPLPGLCDSSSSNKP